MTPYCSRCPARLDQAAVITGFDWCTTCEAKDIAAAVRLRDRGQAAASAAHPADRAKVDAAIRKLAASGRPFSANEAGAIQWSPGGVVGAAFTAARKAGLITRIGREPSSAASTHGHEIGQWLGVASERAA